MSGPVTVRELPPALSAWGAQLIAGEAGQERPVSWASLMRAQPPAFQDIHRDDAVLLSLASVQALAERGAQVTTPSVIEVLAERGAACVLIAGLSPASALTPGQAQDLAAVRARATALGLPVIALPRHAPLVELRDLITKLVLAHRAQQGTPLEPVDAYAAHLRASLRGEALATLLAGAYTGEAQMRLHASQLGYDLTQPHTVLWIELSDTTTSVRDAPPPDPALAEALADALALALGAWTQTRPPDQVVALFPLPGDRNPQELLERLSALIVRTVGGPHPRVAPDWAAGLGDAATAPAHVRRSATEAHDAARLGRTLLGPRHIARPADLGVYRLLLALREQGALEPFIERTLEPLLRDARHADILIETLDAFFACNGNSTRAAEVLNLHRNSLLYRLHQARELLGQDLNDPELRLSLHLAIKGRRVLRLQEDRGERTGGE